MPELIGKYYRWLKVVQPEHFIPKIVRLEKDKLFIKGTPFEGIKRLRVLAWGKASVEMTKAFIKQVGEEHILDGLCIGHYKDATFNSSKVEFKLSSHPFVSELSLEAGKAVVKFAADAREGDLVVVLVSGGGSAMMAHPADGVDFNQKQQYLNSLILKGVGERENNIIRKALSSIKGGRLADLLYPSRIVNLIISDEREHKISAIASGATVLNNDDALASEVFDRYDLWKDAPQALAEVIRSQSSKMNHGSKATISNFIVAQREQLLERIKKDEGSHYTRVIELPPIQPMGFSEGMQTYCKSLKEAMKDLPSGKYLAVSSGELPVIPKKNSKGGRNQHLALALIEEFKNYPQFVFAALATDGCDFLKGIHGAWIDNNTIEEARKLDMKLKDYLEETNSFAFHETLGTLVKGDYSGTNVSDFYFFEFIK